MTAPALAAGWVWQIGGVAMARILADDLVELAVVTDNPKKTKKILEEF